MTAEVGVLNSVGVALAADSAVTVGIRATKIWTSAEKLFQLSPAAPVGVMVYGNANFVGVPWETIVKSYRTHLGNVRFDRLEEYSENFLSYLSDQKDLFPEERQDTRTSELVVSFFLRLSRALRDELDRAAEMNDGLDESDVATVADKFFEIYSSSIRRLKRLEGLGKDDLRIVRRKYSKEIARIKREIFGRIPMSRGTSRRVTTLANEIITREFFGPAQSGLVVAGFGERDCYPSIFPYTLEDMILGKPRIRADPPYVISDDTKGVVVPFAQQEMVYAFMEGVNPTLEDIMKSSTRELFDGMARKLINALKLEGSAVETKIQSSIGSALKDLFGRWQDERVSLWGPVLQIVSTLPKDELGAMAESLINLTRFRRKVTAVPETVAGPIDVAVITKGDGFVWLRRKHYFDPSLNPRTLLRYKKEVDS